MADLDLQRDREFPNGVCSQSPDGCHLLTQPDPGLSSTEDCLWSVQRLASSCGYVPANQPGSLHARCLPCVHSVGFAPQGSEAVRERDCCFDPSIGATYDLVLALVLGRLTMGPFVNWRL